MADFVQGTVAKVSEKDTANGGTVYNVCVDTEDNGEEWFGCGFDNPNLNEGDEIEFDIDYNGKYTNINMDTLVVTQAAPQRESSNRGNGRSGSRNSDGRSGSGRGNSNSRSSGRRNSRSSNNSSSRDSKGSQSKGRSQNKSPSRSKAPAKPEVDWDRKDNLIRLQSSQNTAVATIRIMLANGAVTIPKKKAEAFDAIQALIEEEASRLYNKYEDIVDGNYDQGGDDNDGDYQDDIPE